VANQFLNNREEYNKQAKEWTKNYASPKYQEEKIKLLTEMGFDHQTARVI